MAKGPLALAIDEVAGRPNGERLEQLLGLVDATEARTGGSRALSLCRTKLDEAVCWQGNAERQIVKLTEASFWAQRAHQVAIEAGLAEDDPRG